jgi:hypothetical protein
MALGSPGTYSQVPPYPRISRLPGPKGLPSAMQAQGLPSRLITGVEDDNGLKLLQTVMARGGP